MWHFWFMANQALWGISCNCHSHEIEEDAVSGPVFRYAMSKPCSFGAVSQISELSKFKIRKKKKMFGNDLVLVEFLPVDHCSLLSLSCDLPTPVLKRPCDIVWSSWAIRKCECIYSKQALGACLWYKTWYLWEKTRCLVSFWWSVTL